MWRVAPRIGGVAFGRPLIGSVLGSGFAAPAPVRPTSRSTCCARAGIAQEPMNTDVLAWWKLRDHNEAADPSTGRPEGLLTSLAWSVSGWAHQPRRLVLSVSSPRRAACTTTLRARWRTAPRSTPSLPPPTASSGWSLESRGLEAQNRDQPRGSQKQGPLLQYLVYSGLREVLSSRKLSELMLSSSFCYSDELE